jgi:hypothetical protein
MAHRVAGQVRTGRSTTQRDRLEVHLTDGDSDVVWDTITALFQLSSAYHLTAAKLESLAAAAQGDVRAVLLDRARAERRLADEATNKAREAQWRLHASEAADQRDTTGA